MKFYTYQHRHYCGIDLHTKMMYVCILDRQAQILVHKNIPCQEAAFLRLIEPYREDLVVGVECIFSWYWLADLCAREQITFVLGHALYMKFIHGGNTKNDRLDSEKLARVLLGGNFPQAYVYPPNYRAIRDLLRRRTYLVRLRGEIQGHISITNYQYNLPPFEKHIGKKLSYGGARIGNSHLKWAFCEAAVLLLRQSQRAKDYVARLSQKHGKGKALSILAHKIGRAVYFLMKRNDAFDEDYFFRT